MRPYSSIYIATDWKKSHFISSDWSDFHMIDILSLIVNGFARCTLISLSVDQILLPKYVNLPTNFRGWPLKVEMVPSHLRHLNSVLYSFMKRLIFPAACSRLYSRGSAYAGVFVRSAWSSASSTSDIVSSEYHLWGSLNKFPDFFRMGTFIDSTHMKLQSPSK